MSQKLDEEEASPLTGGDSTKLGIKPSVTDGLITIPRIAILGTIVCGLLFFYLMAGSSTPVSPEIHQSIHGVGKHPVDGAKSTQDDVLSNATFSTTTPQSSSTTTSTVHDLMESFKASYGNLDSRLEERYGKYYKPIFYDSNNMPRGRVVFESGDGSSTVSQNRFRRKLKLKLLTYLTTGAAHFVWATGGHSATAGHGNFFDESYTSYLEQAAKPVFEAMGLQFTGRNYAMGGTAAAPESAMCSKEIYGQDIDALVWDFGMTDGRQWWRQTLYHLRAGLNKGRPITFAYHTGKKGTRDNIVTQMENMGLGALISNEAVLTATMKEVPESFGLSDDELNQLPKFVRNFKCNNAIESGDPYCGIQKFNNTLCEKRKFKTSWHPGWKWQSIMGNLAAFYILDNLGHALLELSNIEDLHAEMATLKAQEDADYDTFANAPIPDSLTALAKEAQKFELDIGLLVKGHNFCHTGRLPAEIRHKGILTESSKTGLTTFDMGEELRDALGSSDEGGLMPLVYNKDDRQVCSVQVNMDYKDFFFVRKGQGWRKLTLPNDSELKEYGTGESLKGHIMSCFTLCAWGKCPAGVLQLDDYYTGKFQMQVNGQNVHNITKFDDCMLLRNEKGFKWEPNSNGRFDVSASVSDDAIDKSYLRFSAFIVW